MYCDAIRRALLSAFSPPLAADRSAPTNSRQKIAGVSPRYRKKSSFCFSARAHGRIARDAAARGLAALSESLLPLHAFPLLPLGKRGRKRRSSRTFAPGIWRAGSSAIGDLARTGVMADGYYGCCILHSREQRDAVVDRCNYVKISLIFSR